MKELLENTDRLIMKFGTPFVPLVRENEQGTKEYHWLHLRTVKVIKEGGIALLQDNFGEFTKLLEGTGRGMLLVQA